MRRVIRWLIPLVLIMFGLLWPLVLERSYEELTADDPVVFSNFAADFRVNADGSMDAVETITAEFPSGRHGLFQFWDIANRNHPYVRQVPEIQSVEIDGVAAPYQMLWEGGKRFRVAKIGDPDEYLSFGTHVFEIRYTVPGVLDPGGTGGDTRFAKSTGDDVAAQSVFFWNVVAGSWNNRMRQVDISVTLPSDVTGAQCSVGFGVGAPCSDLTITGNKVELSTSYLGSRTPVTLRAGVDVPTPARDELLWPYTWDRILGSSLTETALILTLTVAFALGGFLWHRSTVETSPGFPLQYAPPPGLGPVQTEYIRTEAVPRNALPATLFYLAERKLIDLRQINDEYWRIRGLGEKSAWDQLDPVTRKVGHALRVNRPGDEFEAKKTVKSGEKLNKAKTDMAKAVQKWAFDSGLLVKQKKELWIRAANVTAMLLAVCCFLLWFGIPFTAVGLPFVAFFLFTARSWTDGVGTRRTAAGRELWSAAGGFHRMLTTDSAESRFDFSARKDLYTAYVPFAVAAGAAALWAKKYETSTGTVAPQPDWYNASSTSTSSGWGFSGGSGGGNFDSFESALSSSIGAYTASQSSSSSSGGGSSGGGGGGG
uniref:DUF2207 domain-containing protein n=1 Tax=Mycolicibacterium stellerae TaxID=2358193 RepID=UPI0013DDA59F